MLERFIFVLLMSLPGIAFWVHLILWDKFLYQGPGENWTPVLIQLALAWLSLLFLIFCIVSALIQFARKRKSFDWWIASLVNCSPIVFASYFYL